MDLMPKRDYGRSQLPPEKPQLLLLQPFLAKLEARFLLVRKKVPFILLILSMTTHTIQLTILKNTPQMLL